VDHTCAVNRAVPSLTILFVGLLASACGHDVGDRCSTNIDCAQDGSRICDLSQPGGYCTLDGCDDSSCPSEAVCVRFFDQKFPTATDCGAPGTIGTCQADELCVVCGPSVSTPETKSCCVPSTSERRYCALKCGSNGDCRGGYVCRVSATDGSLALTSDPNSITTAKFCAPVEP
jgi:hypothetical protein